MTRRQAIVLGTLAVMAGVAGWAALRIYYAVSGIPDAYAAWDSETLLIEYMKRNADRWPASWDELVDVVRADERRQVALRGAQAGDVAYVQSLRSRVSIDWAFDPSHPKGPGPVAKADGSRSDVVWSGADPNDMIRAYLADRAATRPSE